MRKAEHHQNMLARMRREFRRKYCLHPDAPRGCSDEIVGAHTVQRAMLEKFIAEDGHLGQIRITSHFDEENKIQGLLAKPDPVRLNKATVFAGFCKAHDNDLFRPLENSTFDFHPKQIVLLGYRAICREVYGRDAEIASADAIRNYAAVNPDIWGFAEKDARHEMLHLGRLNARANLASARKNFAEMLGDQSDLRYYGVTFSDRPVYLNVVFRMDWWESILESDRQSLVRRAYNGLPGSDRSSDSLMDDGLTAITSSIFAEHVGY